MPTWLLLVVLSLATYRLTRLATKDDFPPVKWAREQVMTRALDAKREWAYDLVTCHWCASGWVSLALVAGTAAWTDLGAGWDAVLLWWAAWGAGAWLADLDDRKEASQ